ncbi:B2 protein [Zea mays]|uniref:B2 protein n=1 Tax=Zea mays TaxID=4577 RepID=A0A3L6E4K5_MAIZE|nr:B2 protein [Zea mays]
MRHEGLGLSIRHDAAGSMAGAIFMSNSVTRDQCFQASIFGLPLEYRSFVSHIRKGMPLFLFDYTLRKLYGVFEAASDGGFNINSDALRSVRHSYPSQVRINIIWKCKPLSEDEFFPAIEDNYYRPRKFYFDLSYEQVVRLYELFGNKRVGRPIHDYQKNECLQTNRSSKGIPDKESLTPDPHSSNQSRLLVPNISEIIRYSTPTSIHTDLPLNVEAYPSTLMPLGTEVNGAKIAPTFSSHSDQIEPFSQSEFFPAASMTDAVSTQVSAPCSETNNQLVGQSHPLPHNYPQNIFSAGFTAQDPIEGSKFVANQLYSLCRDYMHDGLLTSGYGTQNRTYKGMNHLNSTCPPYDPLHPFLPVSNNFDYQAQCDIYSNQGCPDTCNDICAYECECLSEEVVAAEELNQRGISTCPQVLGWDGKAVSAIHQQNMCSTDYFQISDRDEDSENDQMKHGTHSNASDSSDRENGIVDPRHTQHAVGTENNTKDQCSQPKKGVFSRLSVRKELTSQDATGSTLNQLVSSLVRKTEQWSHNNRPIEDGLIIPLIGEQADCSHAALNLLSELELDKDVSIEPQLPFLNFKRRSEAGKVDANLGKEISGKMKRRKLVRPSLGENNDSTNFGEQLIGNCTQDKNQNHQESENHFDIDLNIPAAPIDDGPVEVNRIAVCPSVVIKVQTEKPYEIDTNKVNSNVMETTEEHDPSSAPTQKVIPDFNMADLNTMDESKLRTILEHTSSLLQALAEVKNGESNNCEQAKSSFEDKKVNMAYSDGATKSECD